MNSERIIDKDQFAYRVLGISSIVAVSALALTVSRKSSKSIGLIQDTVFSAKNPKAAAYIFAGQAFGTATIMVACSAFVLGMGISQLMGVHSLVEFNEKMSKWSQSTFPSLHISSNADQQEDSHLEFVREWIAALEEEPIESPVSAHVSKKLKKKLGLD